MHTMYENSNAKFWKLSFFLSADEPNRHHHGRITPVESPVPQRKRSGPLFRVDASGNPGSTSEIAPSHPGDPVEYFFASDASAIIEHTNKVIFLEDDDVASVKGGVLSIHRMTRSSDDSPDRYVLNNAF